MMWIIHGKIAIILIATIGVFIAAVGFWIVFRIVQSLMPQVREINRKYAKPEIEMTPFIKFCLFGLRIYLLLLVGLMIFKFIVTARG